MPIAAFLRAMTGSPLVRYGAIIVGTMLWDVGAVLQKKAVDRLPGMRVELLLGSPGWMAGLLVTAAGWGLYVFGLQEIGVAAARTVTGGSYVVLALFSLVFLRVRLRPAEWAAVAIVTAGIIVLGRTEPTLSSASALPSAAAVAEGLGLIAVVCAVLVAMRRLMPAFVFFAALAGLLSSAGDLMVKIVLSGPGAVAFVGCAAGLIVFYLAGFYMLSRSYRAGTMVAAVVLSDFAARGGAILLGAVVLGEPVASAGAGGLVRAAGFILVVGGSLLLGRFSPEARSETQTESVGA